jgi:hypothetical protein
MTNAEISILASKIAIIATLIVFSAFAAGFVVGRM